MYGTLRFIGEDFPKNISEANWHKREVAWSALCFTDILLTFYLVFFHYFQTIFRQLSHFYQSEKNMANHPFDRF
ncbi:hypothetical protein CSW08_05285 [Confluentibacter flavum]|uniref:Uncharacterized protein n=1 Tax=Confluentibacter flavum TaxID=1909700 RepID=A0A2N3HLR6_9FLAO|nr:hypothetical protein CSW08_05285 [Confluentibacter flavum]